MFTAHTLTHRHVATTEAYRPQSVYNWKWEREATRERGGAGYLEYRNRNTTKYQNQSESVYRSRFRII